MIVDEGAAQINYRAIEKESEQLQSTVNLLVVQNFHLNPLHRHFEDTNCKETAPSARGYATHYLSHNLTN